MNIELLLLVTLVASVLQAIAGFGFGLIVVPVFLLVLGDSSAVQLVIILTLMMSIFHSCFLHKHIDRQLLKQLSIGSLFGFPVGLMMFEWVPLAWLKLLLAIFLLFFAAQYLFGMIRGIQNQIQYTSKQFSAVGFASGIMTSALAMPGPVVMIFLSRSTLGKDQIRAALIVFMVIAYAGALVFHYLLSGLRPGVVELSFKLLPAALIGVIAGHYLARFVSAYYFRLGVLILLLLTACYLFLNLAMEYF